MVASIGAIASAAQGTSYYEKDGYYASEDPEHRRLSAWTGKGAEALGLEGSVDPDAFRGVLEGKVPDGSGRELGRREADGTLRHRPGRDVTLSAPKSVSLLGLVGGDGRVVDAHDRAVAATLAWIEKNAVETRLKEDRHPVLLMAKRPEDQYVLEPLDPAPFLDRGAPLGDDAFDVRAPAVFEPLGRFLLVLADEGVGDGVNEFRVRRHVVLPSAKIRSGPSRRLSPSPYRNELHPLASTPDGGVG